LVSDFRDEKQGIPFAMIPKVLHFCYGMAPGLGGKPWSLVHYACVRSAIERIKADEVFFYFQYEPKGLWWDLTRNLVNLVKVEAPTEIFGRPLIHPAHRADVLRLEKLLQHGGIYLDCDVFVHRPFDDLLGNSAVLGEEVVQDAAGRILCNAVILAEPGAPFLRAWYEEYRSFRSHGYDQFWDEHSCRIPMRLAGEIPEALTILPPDAFFRPGTSPADIALLFEPGGHIDSTSAYANHLWESIGWKRYLEELTPGRVRAIESNFHRWCRPYVAHLADDFGGPTLVRRLARRLRSFTRRRMAV
jgi:hypothetical protein